MDEVDFDDLDRESLVLVIAATCRDGDVPGNGAGLLDWLCARAPGALAGTSFAVLGVGNSIYPRVLRRRERLRRGASRPPARPASRRSNSPTRSRRSPTRSSSGSRCSRSSGRPKTPRPGPGARWSRSSRPRASPGPNPKEFATVAFNKEMLGTGRRSEPLDPAHRLRHPARSRLLRGRRPSRGPSGQSGRAGRRRLRPSRPAARRVVPHHRRLGGALDRYRDGYPVERLLAEDLDLGMPEAPEELLAAMRAASREPDDRRSSTTGSPRSRSTRRIPARRALRATAARDLSLRCSTCSTPSRVGSDRRRADRDSCRASEAAAVLDRVLRPRLHPRQIHDHGRAC